MFKFIPLLSVSAFPSKICTNLLLILPGTKVASPLVRRKVKILEFKYLNNV